MVTRVDAIASLRPNAEWSLREGNLEWLDASQTQPTEEEIDAEIARLTTVHDATEYQRLRAAEYPPAADYLDAVVKGDQSQMQAYIDACLAVKAKYPKPSGDP